MPTPRSDFQSVKESIVLLNRCLKFVNDKLKWRGYVYLFVLFMIWSLMISLILFIEKIAIYTFPLFAVGVFVLNRYVFFNKPESHAEPSRDDPGV